MKSLKQATRSLVALNAKSIRKFTTCEAPTPVQPRFRKFPLFLGLLLGGIGLGAGGYLVSSNRQKRIMLTQDKPEENSQTEESESKSKEVDEPIQEKDTETKTENPSIEEKSSTQPTMEIESQNQDDLSEFEPLKDKLEEYELEELQNQLAKCLRKLLADISEVYQEEGSMPLIIAKDLPFLQLEKFLAFPLSKEVQNIKKMLNKKLHLDKEIFCANADTLIKEWTDAMLSYWTDLKKIISNMKEIWGSQEINEIEKMEQFEENMKKLESIKDSYLILFESVELKIQNEEFNLYNQFVSEFVSKPTSKTQEEFDFLRNVIYKLSQKMQDSVLTEVEIKNIILAVALLLQNSVDHKHSIEKEIKIIQNLAKYHHQLLDLVFLLEKSIDIKKGVASIEEIKKEADAKLENSRFACYIDSNAGVIKYAIARFVYLCFYKWRFSFSKAQYIDTNESSVLKNIRCVDYIKHLIQENNFEEALEYLNKLDGLGSKELIALRNLIKGRIELQRVVKTLKESNF